ncbi:hypothetical protein LWI28_000743 [Acer negundo]|uniref:Uncharacterized protein n=1 Tax=Acer negundo TaxID=4023 RepID=A0AAD5NK61_ACENE|nr:hypothetical protein LWI28_000743 [Acer negundo]
MSMTLSLVGTLFPIIDLHVEAAATASEDVSEYEALQQVLLEESYSLLQIHICIHITTHQQICGNLSSRCL